MPSSATSDNGGERAMRGRDGQAVGTSALPKTVKVNVDFLKDLMNKVEFLIDMHKHNTKGKMAAPDQYIPTPQVDIRRRIFRDEDDTHQSSLRFLMGAQTKREGGPHRPRMLGRELKGVGE